METWTHQKLGVFLYNGIAWKQERKIEEFKNFTLNSPKRPEGNENIILSMYLDEDDEPPSDEMCVVTDKTLSNLNLLLNKCLQLLFDDISGINNIDSGMWWHNSLDHVNEIIVDKGKLENVSAFYDLLCCPTIKIAEYEGGYDSPCSIIGFDSPIDIEHGIGFLTDGEKVLGIGYKADPCVFKTE